MDATPLAIIHKATWYTMPAKLFNGGKPLYCGPNGEKVLPSELSGLKGCCWTLNTGGVKYRGLPRDAVELQGSAREEFLNNLKGYWKLQPLSGAGRNTITYTDVFVEGDKVILTGGMHNTTQYVGGNYNSTAGRYITTAVANPAQEQKIIPFRSAARGTTYMDNIGSMITRVAPDGSEIEISNALCMKAKWVRPWKLNGQANPNPNAGNATTGTAWNATTGTADDELTKLEKLHKNGILSDEEYTAIKMRVVEKILQA